MSRVTNVLSLCVIAYLTTQSVGQSLPISPGFEPLAPKNLPSQQLTPVPQQSQQPPLQHAKLARFHQRRHEHIGGTARGDLSDA